METSKAKRVLVVEDEELCARALARLLVARGFEVTTVGTVAKAMDELEAPSGDGPFDHVVLDLRLPDGDGENVLAFTEHMKRRPQVVVVAGSGAVDARRAQSLQGRCVYLPKPVVIDTLLAAFNRSPAAIVHHYCESHEFSEQETAIFCSALDGIDDEAIAARVGCKLSTVRTYWARIADKTGTGYKEATLAHLVRWLLERTQGSPFVSGLHFRVDLPKSNVVELPKRG